MPTTMKYTGALSVTSCWCGIHLAIPSDLYAIARRNKDHTVYCPLGHKFVYSNTLEEQLEETKRQLTAEQKRRRATADLLAHEERSHNATRGHVTRKKRQLERVSSGVCPCCNRSFSDLRRHMRSKHPEFDG